MTSKLQPVHPDHRQSLGRPETSKTCDLMLDYLKENVEFMMLDKKGFAKTKRQLHALIEALDPSTRLLFAQKVASTKSDDGNNLIELLFDVFSDDLVYATLDLTDQIRERIKGTK